MKKADLQMPETMGRSPAPAASLSRLMLGGGTVLAMRQWLGAALGIGGVAVITGLIGAAAFGRYAAAAAIVGLLWMLIPTAIVGALVRRQHEPKAEAWRGAVLLLMLGGIAAPAAAFLAGTILEQWSRLDGVALAAAVLMAPAVFAWPAQAAVARLERRLDYLAIARADLLGQSAFVVIGCLLAWARWGTWALVVAGICHHLLAAVLAMYAAGGLPARAGCAGEARQLAGEAAALAAVAASWQARPLIVPLVVGPALGAAAVGQVALAMRMVDTLSAARGAVGRVATAALPRLVDDVRAMRAAIGRAAAIASLATAAPLALAALAVAALQTWIPPEWSACGSVFPGLAVFSIVAGLHAPCVSALVVIGRWRGVCLMHLGIVATIAAVALLAVPPLGPLGYAVAEMSALPWFAFAWWRCRRAFGQPFNVLGLAGVLFGAVLAAAPWWWPGGLG
jgi:O-antigen/teichoic acid export membrane protein